MTSRRILVASALPLAAALALAGCATPTGAGGDDDAFTIVASTNVYGDIAAAVAGDEAEVVSIIDSAAQDPHEYEATAQDQLTVSRADLLIENGGGYDAFLGSLIEASGSTAPALTAAEQSHDWPGEGGDEHADHDHADEDHADHEHADDEQADEEHEDHAEEDHAGEDDGHHHEHIEGFNEHVWYDPHTMKHVAEQIAAELGELLPGSADVFTANAEAFAADIAGLEESLAVIEGEHAGEKIFVTEPVPVYLLDDAGLENVTPSAFSEAVEEGQDVPPATLLDATELVGSGDVRVVIANAQTGGAETTQILDEAESDGIPVLEFSETLPEGQNYISWMQSNIDELSAALTE